MKLLGPHCRLLVVSWEFRPILELFSPLREIIPIFFDRTFSDNFRFIMTALVSLVSFSLVRTAVV